MLKGTSESPKTLYAGTPSMRPGSRTTGICRQSAHTTLERVFGTEFHVREKEAHRNVQRARKLTPQHATDASIALLVCFRSPPGFREPLDLQTCYAPWPVFRDVIDGHELDTSMGMTLRLTPVKVLARTRNQLSFTSQYAFKELVFTGGTAFAEATNITTRVSNIQRKGI